MKLNKKIVLVLGIRPDIIRSSLIINKLKLELGNNFKFVWSGQHYSENLKDIFFRELNVPKPDFDLGVIGKTDAEIVSNLLIKLEKYFLDVKPAATVFLGDTNTVMGTIAAAQLNIPVLHIEGCMRSYDWRMPEEKYRTISDHLSDFIYAYLDDYKKQGVAEGIPDENIMVTGNPIVDVLQHYFLSGKLRLTTTELHNLLKTKYFIEKNQDFFLMTCHRRENVTSIESIKNIFGLVRSLDKKVIFPMSYRTQAQLVKFNLPLPENLIAVEPVGYLELLELLNASIGVLTDSGTIIEESTILGKPGFQLRKSTERPQVYAVKAAVKLDPTENNTDYQMIIDAFYKISQTTWKNPFGDGQSSNRISEDIVAKSLMGNFFGHNFAKYRPYSDVSLMG